MKVGYAYSQKLIEVADKLPSNVGRASRVQSLINAFGLLDNCDLLEPVECSKQELCAYHDQEFIEYLLNVQNSDSYSEDYEELKELYGLQYDCPEFEGLADYIKLVCGATLSCADYLIINADQPRVSINWTGGRHHAKRASSSGFCYVNDIVLGILRLRTKFDRVMYIDIDLHHGDGVEAAFARSQKVMCLSIHRYDKGFYPGTGNAESVGKGNGEGYTVNIPTKRGLSDQTLQMIFDDIVEPRINLFGPDAIVVCCGCDGLSRDQHGEWNLTMTGIEQAVKRILDFKKPTMLVGGGGYHHPDTARCWTLLTALASGVDSNEFKEIPESDEFFEEYVTDAYQFLVTATANLDDENRAS